MMLKPYRVAQANNHVESGKWHRLALQQTDNFLGVDNQADAPRDGFIGFCKALSLMLLAITQLPFFCGRGPAFIVLS